MWNESSPEDDRELVARCIDGDTLAFEELVKKYQQSVLNLVYHYIGTRSDVEDIAQKIFIKVYFSLPKFESGRPFFPWLYRIAVNKCYDELRHIRRRKTYTFSELNLDDAAGIERLIRDSETSERPDQNPGETHALLQKLISRLPDHQRRVIVLRDIEAIPYTEISAILNCTEQAARLKVFRARKRLKKILETILPESKQPEK
ncbi:MAG: RNA polymerase sigma factor [Acidobacteria bacterium]|nr:RNA polymerase sigma factor [Acidobacteriota bacterium]